MSLTLDQCGVASSLPSLRVTCLVYTLCEYGQYEHFLYTFVDETHFVDTLVNILVDVSLTPLLVNIFLIA